ncbi:MAG: FAD-dependent monooxygenase [Hyphomicrobiales bacterium]|nr:FAD-dependent monooxygenase [Hyphomicrobiales bacterium]
MRAVIAGAGIGGLATALALSQAGLDVKLYERSETLQEFGAGLQLTPNATRILSALGVLEAVQTVAVPPETICLLRGSDDQLLARMRVDDAERRWGAPYLTVHRADLQQILAEIAQRRPTVEIEMGSTVVAIAAKNPGMLIGLRRGLSSAEDRADLLIAADGLRSCGREYFGLGEADNPVFTGHVALRATVDANVVDPRCRRQEVCLCLGPRAHLVHYPLRSGSIINVVCVIETDQSAAHPASARTIHCTEVIRHFEGWSSATRKLLEAAISWRAWPIFVRPPIASFSRGSVALVGDAAHPIAPFLAQGAGQAIEDAGALAQVFCRQQSVKDALLAYSRKRVARATRVQIAAQRQGRLYHYSGGMAVARDATMRLLGGERLRAECDWLYGN